MRLPLLLIAASLALPLAACQSSAPPPPAGASAPVAAAPSSLPSGPGCRGNLARFRAVIDSDAETGNVNKSVYDRMMGDLKQAEAFCAAGNESAANAAIASTKSRYGYPA